MPGLLALEGQLVLGFAMPGGHCGAGIFFTSVWCDQKFDEGL